MTPEGEVKKAVKTYLEMIGCIPASKAPLATPAHHGWYFMPVPFGHGVSGIPDFIIFYKGFGCVVETKDEKKNPTPLQQHQLNAITVSGGKAFVVRGCDDLQELKDWVMAVNLGLN